MDLFVIFYFQFYLQNFLFFKTTSTKMTTDLEIHLHRIHLNIKKNSIENKKNWYKIGKVLLQREKVWLHNESKVGTKRTYHLYFVIKGDWEDSSSRILSKINKTWFDEVLENRQLDNLMAELQNQFNKEYWQSNIFPTAWTC